MRGRLARAVKTYLDDSADRAGAPIWIGYAPRAICGPRG